MYRVSPAIACQLARFCTNALLAGKSSSSYGWAWQLAMGQRRTRTFVRGEMFFGALSVNWYASVSISLSGYSFSIASATWLTNHRYTPDCTPPYLATFALHSSQSHHLSVSFCDTVVMTAV